VCERETSWEITATTEKDIHVSEICEILKFDLFVVCLRGWLIGVGGLEGGVVGEILMG